MTDRVDIAVVIVGINSCDYLQRCVESLARVEWKGYSYRIVYIDNASADGSVELMRSRYPDIIVIANDSNRGFCAACNQGVEATNSRYIYLLNNDTITCPDSVVLLADFLEENPDVAAAGNRLLNPDMSDQWSARRFPTWLSAITGRNSWLGRIFPDSELVQSSLYKDQISGRDPFPVDWIPGSCTLVRRNAYEQVNGLPETMHYWSDAVFCHRLRKAGWEIYLVPKAKLIHFEGKGTGGKTTTVRCWLIRDFHRGAYRFYCEYYRLRLWNPIRWVAGLGLSLRAGLLIVGNYIYSGFARTDQRRNEQ